MYNPIKEVNNIVVAFCLITLLFFIIVLGFSITLRENSQRIREIQNSRIQSCEETYSAIRQVFSPFLSKPPMTDRERVEIEQFYNQINKLREGCRVQTATKKD